MYSLYIHIPYCLRKCHYCNFNSIPCQKPPEEEYILALIKELEFYLQKKEWQNRKLYTIYLGGGTPSLFSGQAIFKLLNKILELCDTTETQEITIECNPCTVTEEKLHYYKEAKINRISLGVQSFNPKTLKTLGRLHSVEDTFKALELIKKTNFNNISLDLMFGIPNQTLIDLETDLSSLIKIAPQHLSAYCLSIEHDTPLEKQIQTNLLKPLEEELTLEMLKCVSNTLQQNSYEHYEISNYALTGFHSKHNSAYWSNLDYLGLGAGASSYNQKNSLYGKRWTNITNPTDYIKKSLSNESTLDFLETLSKENAKTEFFMLNLRKKVGFSREDFELRFNEPFLEKYADTLKDLESLNLIQQHDQQISLTQQGFLIGDSVIEKFIN